ncbi:protein Brevis radix-like 1 [Dioscorea cayenensis subsp. rotundata]|uniref:Protein Brevis radix-like 1 n=1 Tax=Dioscorea cayennensis subsp. rotundata TaxID=55577 RepID=A0AB40CU49_DIOCR|nr:protein Brevis radix-like 1 [Dioscorea cayenensis subsp. rotundata]XP_039142033.1 protein Brevis radix-like 1 [Dioscorea cayenensis subsp. rotundata]
MLACIACSKQLDDGEDDSTSRAPGTKEPVKSLTSQIKDLVLKISGGGNRQCKGASSSSSYRSKSVRQRGHQPRYTDGSTSDGGQCKYVRSASSSSMPTWGFTTNSHNSDSETRQRRQWISGGIGFPPEDDDNYNDNDDDDDDVVLQDNGEPKEWMAQVEPGVHITFVSLPGGAGNDLKRIRFSREMFNKWQAQRWWGENYDRIMELYNVQRFSSQALPTPPRSEDGEAHIGLQRNSSYPRVGSARDSPTTQTQPHHHVRSKERVFPNTSSSSSSRHKTLSLSPRGGGGTRSVPDPSESMLQQYFHPAAVAAAFGGGGGGVGSVIGGLSGMGKGEASSVEASRTTTSSRDEAASVSISNASDLEVTEWVEQDEPGVYITIRELPDGTRELRRVRFSREKFGEVRAKLWWEENRERIQAQYL